MAVTNNKETLKDSTIIYDGGKRYKVINIDEIGKTAIPHRIKQKANKVKNSKTNKHHSSKTNKKKMLVKRTLKTNVSSDIIEKLPENALGNDPRLKEVFKQFGKN